MSKFCLWYAEDVKTNCGNYYIAIKEIASSYITFLNPMVMLIMLTCDAGVVTPRRIYMYYLVFVCVCLFGEHLH